jgi:hypothetical protein
MEIPPAQPIQPNPYAILDENQTKKSYNLLYNNSSDTISRGVIAVS